MEDYVAEKKDNQSDESSEIVPIEEQTNAECVSVDETQEEDSSNQESQAVEENQGSEESQEFQESNKDQESEGQKSYEKIAQEINDEQEDEKELAELEKEIEHLNNAPVIEEEVSDDAPVPLAVEQTVPQECVDTTDDITTHIKGVLESLLFVNERPITLEQIKKVLDTVSGPEIKNALKMLSSEYAERKSGFTIKEIAGGYQMFSNSAYASYVKSFYKKKHKEKLSKPALESLAIIAYKQPVTRADIEVIRGVNSDGVVAHLFNKELIKIVGRKDVPGRPYLYGTTKQFLEYFGLKSLDTLPKLEEFPSLMESEDEKATKVVEDEIIATVPQQDATIEDIEKKEELSESVDDNSEQKDEENKEVSQEEDLKEDETINKVDQE